MQSENGSDLQPLVAVPHVPAQTSTLFACSWGCRPLVIPSFLISALRSGAASLHVMHRGIFDRQRLHRRPSLHQRHQLRRDFLEKAVVVVRHIRGTLPHGHAAEFPSGGIERFDVLQETRQRLYARQELFIDRRLEFINLGGIYVASDDPRNHDLPPCGNRFWQRARNECATHPADYEETYSPLMASSRIKTSGPRSPDSQTRLSSRQLSSRPIEVPVSYLSSFQPKV